MTLLPFSSLQSLTPLSLKDSPVGSPDSVREQTLKGFTPNRLNASRETFDSYSPHFGQKKSKGFGLKGPNRRVKTATAKKRAARTELRNQATQLYFKGKNPYYALAERVLNLETSEVKNQLKRPLNQVYAFDRFSKGSADGLQALKSDKNPYNRYMNDAIQRLALMLQLYQPGEQTSQNPFENEAFYEAFTRTAVVLNQVYCQQNPERSDGAKLSRWIDISRDLLKEKLKPIFPGISLTYENFITAIRSQDNKRGWNKTLEQFGRFLCDEEDSKAVADNPFFLESSNSFKNYTYNGTPASTTRYQFTRLSSERTRCHVIHYNYQDIETLFQETQNAYESAFSAGRNEKKRNTSLANALHTELMAPLTDGRGPTISFTILYAIAHYLGKDLPPINLSPNDPWLMATLFYPAEFRNYFSKGLFSNQKALPIQGAEAFKFERLEAVL